MCAVPFVSASSMRSTLASASSSKRAMHSISALLYAKQQYGSSGYLSRRALASPASAESK